MSSKSSANGGIGILGLLFVLFVGLKLTGHITWSWWWVFSPLWGIPAIILGVIAIYGLFRLVMMLIRLALYSRK